MSDMEKINAFTRRALSEDEVYIFTVKLCNNDVDRDYEKFSLQALRELAPLFVGKTGIFDHSMKSADQRARIFDTFLERENGKKTADGEDFYALKAKAYMLRNEQNRALIEEIEGGIKKEVSVSCAMSESICSVCGKNRRAGGCAHVAGRQYGGKTAYFTLQHPTDAYEFSFVAVPAQKEAGVTKAFAANLQKENGMDSILKTIKSCAGEVTLTKAQAEEISSYIDKLQEGAELGEVYKKELSKEVQGMLALALPQVDKSLFTSLVGVMTVKELLGFKDGLKKSAVAASLTPQLAKQEKNKHDTDFSQFRI